MLHPDPFRDIDRLAAQLLGTSPGSARVPLAMPMDLYRSGDHYVLHADLPGVDPDSVDVSVDGGILTVTAQRSERTEPDVQWLSSSASPAVTCVACPSARTSTPTTSPPPIRTGC